MNTAEDLGQSFVFFVEQSKKSAEIIELLQVKVEKLTTEVAQLKEHSGDDGWMKASVAAPRIGMTVPALRQRIRNKNYEEGVVWRRSDTRQIIVNLAELRKVI